MKEINTAELTKLADQLAGLNVAELQAFKQILKDKYGLVETVAVAAPVVVEEKEEKEEVKSVVNIMLVSVSAETGKKLQSVKLINKLTNLGLQPSMALTKELPALVKENVSRTEAEEFKNEMAALDAVIELK